MDIFKELKLKLKKARKKILFFDLETSLMTVYTHYIGQKVSIQHNQIKKDMRIICATYKWEGDSTSEAFVSVYDKNNNLNDRPVCDNISKLLSQADVVIAQNGKSFDVRKLQWRLAELGLPSVSNITMIDTLREAQKAFASPSHKLDFRSKQYGFGGKKKMEMQDWIDIDNGSKKALKKMVTYGLKDCDDLQNIFWKELPYYQNLQVKLGLLVESREQCHSCSSSKVQKRGTVATLAGLKQKYTCNNCGKSWTDTRLIKKNWLSRQAVLKGTNR